MDLLLIFTLAAIAGAVIIARVVTWTTNRASHGAVTSYFRAGEYILEYHQPPPQWTAPARRFWLPFRARQPVTQADMLARLDDLIGFFEQSTFFEDEWAREQLLQQLEDERAAWLADLMI